MESWNQRTELIIGKDGVDRLAASRILIVGVGGVGAYAAEMTARAGVGTIDIVDGDNVGITNINRQLPALHSTLGMSKVELVKQRLVDINPELQIEARQEFITSSSVAALLGNRDYDFVLDAIDSIAPKVALIEYCIDNGVSIVSSMGAGGRMNPEKIRYTDIWRTENDGLAKAVRTRLKADGYRGKKLPVVWSGEPPAKHSVIATSEIANKRSSYGTISYLPTIFGCMLGAYAIRKLLRL